MHPLMLDLFLCLMSSSPSKYNEYNRREKQIEEEIHGIGQNDCRSNVIQPRRIWGVALKNHLRNRPAKDVRVWIGVIREKSGHADGGYKRENNKQPIRPTEPASKTGAQHDSDCGPNINRHNRQEEDEAESGHAQRGLTVSYSTRTRRDMALYVAGVKVIAKSKPWRMAGAWAFDAVLCGCMALDR